LSVVVGLAICLHGLSAQDSDKEKKDSTKRTKVIQGKVLKADSVAETIIIITDDAKERMFTTDPSTKFFGPKGRSRKGLDDRWFKEGNEVMITPDASGKKAIVVRTVVRKGGSSPGEKGPGGKGGGDEKKPPR
jgi:hypothetical protein